MKKTRLLVASILTLVLAASTCLLSACNPSNSDSEDSCTCNPPNPDSDDSCSYLGEKMYSFGALSDIHLGYESRGGSSDFKRAIAGLQNLGVEFVGISGDIGYHSATSELQTYKEIIDTHATVPFYACTGNHDATHTDEVWEEYIGHPRNFEFVKNGDVFLFMSLMNESNSANVDTPYADNLDWLQERLVRYTGARIFVFMHFPITDYAGLTNNQYYGFTANSTEDDELMKTLMNTENVVVFSGHTHYKFGCEAEDYDINVFNMPNKKVSLVHVPSCAYPRNSERNEEADISQGYVVDVYDNGVVLRGVDLVSGEYMPEYVYELTNKGNPSVAATPTVMLSKNDIRLTSSSTTEIMVTLSNPVNTVVNIADNNDYILVSPSTLTFTEENYNVPQKVIVTTNIIENNESAVITLSGNGIIEKTIKVELSNAGVVEFTDETYAPQNGDIFTGTVKDHRIHTDKAGEYNLTFDNFSMTHKVTTLYLSSSGVELTLNLKGNNTLQCTANDGHRGMSSSGSTPGKIIGIGEGATLTIKAQGTLEALKGDYDITNASVIVEHTSLSPMNYIKVVKRGINIIDNGSFSINGAKVELLSSEHGSLTVSLGDCKFGESVITITGEADGEYSLSHILVNGVQHPIDYLLMMPSSGETISIQGVFTK